MTEKYFVSNGLIAIVFLQEDEEEAPKAVKTDFTVKLMKFDEKQKVPLIKEIKTLVEGMNLVQVRELSLKIILISLEADFFSICMVLNN